MELPAVKNYLKVDLDDDDEFIKLAIEAAKEIIVDAVGKYDETKARAKILLLVIVDDMYHNRVLTTDKANEKVRYTMNSLILQLQLGD